MTIRTLFTVILKVLGILFIKNFLETIPQLFSLISFMSRFAGSQQTIIGICEIAAMLLIYGLLSFYLIFKTDLVIDTLRLDKGFEQEIIPLNIHRTTILSIAIIVIGGLLIINETGNFCRQLVLYFQEKQMAYMQKSTSFSYVILSAAKIIIGLVLLGNQKLIVHFIEMRRKK